MEVYMKKKVLVVTLLLFLLSGTVFSGCAARNKKSAISNRKTVKAGRRDIKSIVNLSGIVKTEPRVAVIPKVSGEVIAVYVREGDTVKKGDKIFQVDSKTVSLNYQNALNAYNSASLNYEIAKSADPDIAVEQAEANVESARSALEIAKLNLEIAQETDSSVLQEKNAEEQVKQAEINLENAKTNLDSLRKSDTTNENIEISKLQLQNQQLALAIAQLNLKGLKESGPTDDDIKQGEEQLTQAKINLENANENLKKAADNPNTPDEDIKILENQVKLAESNVKLAELSLDKLKNHTGPTAEQVSQAEDQVEQAKISLQIAGQNYQSALKAKDAKDAQIAQAENQVKLAESQLEAAKNNLQIAKDSAAASPDTLSIRSEQVKQAESSLKVAEANLENAKEQVETNSLRVKQVEAQKNQSYVNVQIAKETLNNYTVTAPIDGTVILLKVNKGDTVSPGVTAAIIGDVSHFVVDAYADEIDAVNIKKDQDVEISFDAFPYKKLEGSVESVAYTTTTTNQGVQAYEVKVALPKTELNIKDGLSATLDITTAVKKDVLSVPIESVATENGKSYVIVVLPENKFEKRFVQTGISSDNYTEILSGLKEGDEILEIPSADIFGTIKTNKSPFGGAKKGGG
jgi:HlyD family secretion protein